MMTEAPTDSETPGEPAGRLRLARRGGAFLCVLLAAALIPSAGPWAEEPPADPDLSTRGLKKAGPFYLRPFLTVKDLGYDDNVFFDAENPEGDYTATAVPGLRVLLLGRHRGGLLLDQKFNYVAFRNNSGINHWNSDTRARGVLLAGRSILSLEDHFQSIRERPSNEIDRRVRRTVNDITGQLKTDLGGRFNAKAWMGRRAIRYADGVDVEQIADRLDRNESTLSVAGEVRIRPRTTFFVETTFRDVNFRNPEEIRDSEALSVVPGIRIDPSARIQGEIKGGLVSLDAPNDDEVGDPNVSYDDYRGFIGEASIRARLGSSSAARIEAERSLPFSLLANNLYAIKSEWSATFEQFFSRRFSAEARYGRSLYDYPGDVKDSKGLPSHREDEIGTYTLTFKYRLGGELALTAGAQRQLRDSSDDELDRTRNLFTIGTALQL